MPRPGLEAVGCHEHTDEDGNGERDECGNSANTEERASSQCPAEDKEKQDYANTAVDDDGVDGGECAGVDGRDELAEGEDAVAGVREGDAGGGDHAALAHGEAGDDGEGEDGEGDVLRENLDGVCCEGLAQVGLNAAGDVDDGVSCDEGEEPAELEKKVVSSVRLIHQRKELKDIPERQRLTSLL